MKNDNKFYDVVVIGAGAAGFMCAIEAGKRGLKVLLIDKAQKIGEKIRISGGGRCNFTNINAAPENYISSNPHFCKSALSRYTAHDFIELVKKHKINFHEKKLGQLFCDNGSKEIIDMLFMEANENGVQIQHPCTVEAISLISEEDLNKYYDQKTTNCSNKNKQDLSSNNHENISNDSAIKSTNKFLIETNVQNYFCSSLVIATGGLSIPQIGASDFAHQLAKQFNLNIVETRPALVPLTFSGYELKLCNALSGVSIDTVVSLNGKSFRENILFTHKGLSGPAILQISSYWRPGEKIAINLLPDVNLEEALKKFSKDKSHGKKSLKTIIKNIHELTGNKNADSKSPKSFTTNPEQDKLKTKINRLGLPDAFVDELDKKYGLSLPIAEYSNEKLEEIADSIQNWNLLPSGTEGYNKAEVTVGGVDTNELSSKTMESKKISGLFFIGEAVDVTGWLGGYNFQWAWASGFVAGQYC